MIESTSRSGRRKGLAAVELALVLPLLMIILLGVIEFSWLFFAFHVTASAAREACRIGVTTNATQAQVQNAIDSRMAAGGFDSYTKTFENPWGYPVGSDYHVTVELNYSSITSFPGIVEILPDTLRREVVMRKEGPPWPTP